MRRGHHRFRVASAWVRVAPPRPRSPAWEDPFTGIGGGAAPIANRAWWDDNSLVDGRKSPMTQSTLTVWKFDTPDGARGAVRTLENLQKQNLITVLDYATVSWEADKKKPTTKQGSPTSSSAALGGAFWGMLFGLIFFVPLLGAAVGAASGALAGSLADVGIDDDFIKGVRHEVTPGTSALFVMTTGAVLDRIKGDFAQQPSELIYTNLSEEQETALRRVFEEE
jgi:uncharacterized membrane protein